MRIKRQCENCGAEYWTGSGKAKYCFDRCRREAHSQQQKEWRAARPGYQKQWRQTHSDKEMLQE